MPTTALDTSTTEFAQLAAIVNRRETRDDFVCNHRVLQRKVAYFASLPLSSRTGKRLRVYVERCRADEAEYAAAIDAIEAGSGDVTQAEKDAIAPVVIRLVTANYRGKFVLY